LSASASSPTSATLSWTAATDDVGIAGYRIYRNGVQISTTSATSYADSGLSAATTYTYSVRAYDAAGNVSAGSNTASVTTPVPPDTTAPSAPAALSGRASGGTVSLSWSAATDDVGVVGYQLFRNGVQLATTTGTSFVDAAVVESATYTYTVRAYDVAGNVGPPSSALSVTTPAEEISRPVAPPAGGSPPPASDPPAGPQPPAQPPKPSAQEVSRLQRLLARWTARLRNSPALVHLARVLITR
jgi:cellulose 1,4-beta-cellobiosidase